MSVIEVFDPPMCCSTGVCGPSVDPALATFAGDLDALAARGITVQRHNLSQEPVAFVQEPLISDLLATSGDAALPAVVVNGELRASGRYPSIDELTSWAATAPADGIDAVTAELIAVGAAVGASCQPCLRFHVTEARRVGASDAAIGEAVRLAHLVVEASDRVIADLASRLLENAAAPGTSREDDGSTALQIGSKPTSVGDKDGGSCCGDGGSCCD